MDKREPLSWGPIVVAISMAVLSVIGIVAAMFIWAVRVEDAVDTPNHDRIRVFLKDDATPAQVQALESELRNMDEVKSVVYVSKDEAMKNFRDQYSEQEDVLDEIEGNPLPAELVVRTTNPVYNKLVISRIESRPIIATDESGKPDIKDGNVVD